MKTPHLLQRTIQLSADVEQVPVSTETSVIPPSSRVDAFARASVPVRRSDPGVPVVGSILGGAYRVESVLGTAAMHLLYTATELKTNRRVALQVLRPEAARRPELSLRFLREARAAQRIHGEHAARVLDVGTLESGAPYMATEYIEGTDLARMLRGRGPLPLPELCDIGVQICEALAEAHAAGVLHKNLEPAKLILTTGADGAPLLKVLAFGISRMSALDPCDSGAMTAAVILPSSPLYRAPEQLRAGKEVDARADIWAIGAILFELSAGTPPFHAPTPLDLAVAVAREAPRSLRAIRPDLPKEFEKIILRCLEKDPDKRFARASDLAAALRKLGRAR
ncbi:MAG: serine/threonine-protein kinase [Byssovorax sp.]